MHKFFLGVLTGICLLFFVVGVAKSKIAANIGAVASNGDLPGIYNANPNDLALRDGYPSALLVDNAGRAVVTTTNP